MKTAIWKNPINTHSTLHHVWNEKQYIVGHFLSCNLCPYGCDKITHTHPHQRGEVIDDLRENWRLREVANKNIPWLDVSAIIWQGRSIYSAVTHNYVVMIHLLMFEYARKGIGVYLKCIFVRFCVYEMSLMRLCFEWRIGFEVMDSVEIFGVSFWNIDSFR